MLQVLYISCLAPFVTETDLRNIAFISARNNRRADVTGLLVCSGRHVLQGVEGTKKAVRATLARIATDPRHSGMRVLLERPITRRSYARWVMADVFSLDLADELAALFDNGVDSGVDIADLLQQMAPDSMFGGL